MLNKKNLVVVLFAVFYATTGFGQITSNVSYFTFNNKKPPIANITVSNSATDRAVTVETEVVKITTPGKSNETPQATQDLLASPKQFAVPANGSRVVRIVLRTFPKDFEQQYRVNFIPKASEKIEAAKKASFGLTVLTGSGILIFADPQTPKAQISWSTEGKDIKLKNTGNINIFVSDFELCKRESSACIKPENLMKRLYAGDSIIIPSSSDKDVNFSYVLHEADGTFSLDSSNGSHDF